MNHQGEYASIAPTRRFVAAAAAIVMIISAFILAPAASASPTVSSSTPAAAAELSPASAGSAPQAPGGPVLAADLSQFRPGDIISDAKFFDKNTMSEAQIQAFLQTKVPSCSAGYTCLKDWYDTSRTTVADAMCGPYSGGYRERASTIIYKVAQACGINPQVFLVMLQKEQGLVQHRSPDPLRYKIAMGQGCPDTAACDSRYYGFFNQVHGAAWQLKRYANPPGTSQFFTWYAPGKTWNVRYHPNVSCGSSPVFIQNQATANLYYYTPYQPNAAALAAGYAEANDACSAYGNRNFFNYFTDWFGSTHYLETDTPFVDVSSVGSSRVFNGFASDIVWMASMGITTGWALPGGAREFRPSHEVTRDGMAAFLYRLAGSPSFTPPAVSPFVDVPVDHALFKEIAWLAASKITTGWQVTDTTSEFRPDTIVTRGEMAAFMYRFAGNPSFVTPTVSPFVDVQVGGLFFKEIAWLSSTGISVGWPLDATTSEFRPGLSVSRDVMAAFVHRLHRHLNE